RAALAEGPAHAYLFHGPRGVGKRRDALAFAGALLGDPDRVSPRAHPDLYVLDPLGGTPRTLPCAPESRSATRSGSTRCATSVATCTCARSRRRGACTSSLPRTR